MTFAGKEAGKVAGRAAGTRAVAGGIASYLPTLYGSIPIWHHASTTPNVDGAISALADISLGLYPLTQVSGSEQPTRGSGVITFDDSSDFVASTDAALLAMGNLTSHDACLLLAGYLVTSAGADVVGGWSSSGSEHNRLEATASQQMRLRKDSTAANSTTALTAPIKAIVVNWLSGAEGDALGYVDGALAQTLAVTGATPSAQTGFSFGASAVGTVPCGLVLKAAGAMGRVATATEITQWGAWVAAGCPL